MKENPLDRTGTLEMKRPPTVEYHCKKEDEREVKVNIIFIIAVIFFGLGYVSGSY